MGPLRTALSIYNFSLDGMIQRIIFNLQELVGPLQTALSLGLQYPPLAQAAMSALERWEVEQPQAIEAVAPHIVPLLDPYLAEIKDVAAAADAGSAEGESLHCIGLLEHFGFVPSQFTVCAPIISSWCVAFLCAYHRATHAPISITVMCCTLLTSQC